jgi:hypothetical protein
MVGKSVVDQDPYLDLDPHHSGNLDPHQNKNSDPDPHQIKIGIRIRIQVISWILTRI